ncbi:MAG: threonine-phosphate decarboxylase CobD [Steroidobacteraceae bacterium]
MDGGAATNRFTKLSQHGGRLSAAQAAYPNAPTPWIDLSTGINPRAYPAPRSSSLERARLPDPAKLAELESIAAAAFGVRDGQRIIATAGSELALRLLPVVLGVSGATVVGPTYSSHPDAWRKADRNVSERMLHDVDDAVRGGGALIVVNPNNPDGAVLDRERLLALHDALAQNGGVLIVDEAFIEVAPDHSVSDVAGSDRTPSLVTIRSFGKFYGLAGLRLGFAIGAPRIIERLRHLLGDWPISSEALGAGLAAYGHREWAESTRERLQRSARRLDGLLVRAGCELVGGTSLFRLVRHAHAAQLFEHLLRMGILTRPFDHDPTLLRFGLPHGSAAWSRLGKAVKRWEDAPSLTLPRSAGEGIGERHE